MNYKVSIIVPVYNVEKYIRRCIESLINQTYSNIEIILVDDGSKDNSRKIIEEYKLSDKRIKAIYKENGGLSSARNIGLDKATGDYILFVDSDDYISKNTISILLSKMQNDIDIIMFPYEKIYSNESKKVHLFNESEILYYNKDVRSQLLSYLIGPSNKTITPLNMDRLNTAWGKLYRSSMINNIRFVDTKIIGTEDGWFNIQVFSNLTGKVLYTEDVWYNYEKTNSTSLLSTYKENFAEQRWNFYGMVDEFLIENNLTNLKENLVNRIIFEFFGIIINEILKGESVKNTVRKIKIIYFKNEYKKYFCQVSLAKFSLIWNIFFTLCKYELWYIIVFFIKIIIF